MPLINNTAKERSINDEGLSVDTDLYIKKSILISKLGWKDAKSKIDDMEIEELDRFISIGKDLNLSKIGSISVRVSVSDYATLLLQAKKGNISVSTGIINATKK